METRANDDTRPGASKAKDICEDVPTDSGDPVRAVDLETGPEITTTSGFSKPSERPKLVIELPRSSSEQNYPEPPTLTITLPTPDEEDPPELPEVVRTDSTPEAERQPGVPKIVRAVPLSDQDDKPELPKLVRAAPLPEQGYSPEPTKTPILSSSTAKKTTEQRKVGFTPLEESASRTTITPGVVVDSSTPSNPPDDIDRDRQAQYDRQSRRRRHSLSGTAKTPSRSPPKTSAPEETRTRPQRKGSPDQKPPPHAATVIDKTPKGWRMKTRTVYTARPKSRHNVDIVLVYIYNSSSTNGLDENADMAPFIHEDAAGSTAEAPIPSIRRARTAQVSETKLPILPSFVIPSSAREPALNQPSKMAKGSRSGRPRRQLNWLSSPEMLPKQFPGSRVLTVGFDVAPALTGPLNFEAAGAQLIDYLLEVRKDSAEKPILFLGHTYGGIFLIQALTNAAKPMSKSHNILRKTAGVFLFSCTYIFSQTYTALLADCVSEKPTAKLFANTASGIPSLSKLAQTFKTTILQRKTWKKNVPNAVDSSEPKSHDDATLIQVGFPVIQFIVPNEQPEDQASTSALEAEFLKLSTRTMHLSRDFKSALRFSNPRDDDFFRITMLMQSGLRTHQFLHTVASSDHRLTRKMINDRYNVNIRDRWNQSALHIAVQRSDGVMSQLLLQSGADPNIPDETFNTPLHYAIKIGNAGLVAALLKHGADINFENCRKQTPKDLASKRSSQKRIADMLKSQLVEGPDHASSTVRLGNGSLPKGKEGKLACQNYQIVLTEIYESDGKDRHWEVSVSVQELLYSNSTLDEILHTVRPDSVRNDTPFCVWIHIPENNMIWVEDLFNKLNIHPAIWHEKRALTSESLRNRTITPHVDKGDKVKSVFVPYLSYETKARQGKRIEFIDMVDSEYRQESSTRRIIEQHIPKPSLYTGESLPSTSQDNMGMLQVPEEVVADEFFPSIKQTDDVDDDSDSSVDGDIFDPHGLDEEEKALIKTYLHSPAALHIRRTLDQYYYHMLESTTDRDEDQVVSRWAVNVKHEFLHNIIMVDQLWLWTVDSALIHSETHTPNSSKPDYVISCFPGRTGTGHSSHRMADDLRHSVLLPDRKFRDPVTYTSDLVSRILETCFNSFDKLHNSELLRFFNIFEDSIGTVDDKETKLFRNFRDGLERRHGLERNSKRFDTLKQELLEQLLDIRDETKLLVEIKDIRDEINIILSVLKTQQRIVKQLSGDRPVNGDQVDGIIWSLTVARLVEGNIDDFTKLDSQAKTVQDNLNTLMDLKQKAANAWEAREARECALEAGRQGNTMLVFTIVTIIFLPLSFMSSFFAVGIAVFPKDPQSGETNWPLSTVSGFIFGISLSVSLPLILFALHMQRFASTWREIRHNHIVRGLLALISLLPPSRKYEEWSERLKRDREIYLTDNAVPEERIRHDIFDDDDANTLTKSSTFGSSMMGSTVGSSVPDSTFGSSLPASKSADGGGSSLFKRFRLPSIRKRMRRNNRDNGDEEAMKDDMVMKDEDPIIKRGLP